MSFYDGIRFLTYETNCIDITIDKWDMLMNGATRADKDKVNSLVRKHCPEIANSLMLNEVSLKKLRWWNPYDYFKTKTHLILVHSSIEYFFKIH
jgi:hypothetical protein